MFEDDIEEEMSIIKRGYSDFEPKSPQYKGKLLKGKLAKRQKLD